MPQTSPKIIVLVGASMGIGAALAQALANPKHHLVLIARSETRLAALCRSLETQGATARYFCCDLSQPAEVERLAAQLLAHLDRIDGFIYNAGIGLYGPFEQLEGQDMREMFEVNFFALEGLTRALLPLLKKSRHATVMTVSSIVSWRSIPHLGLYCASKAALNAWVEALRIELKAYGIRIVNTYPGRTQTDFFKNAKTRGWTPLARQLKGATPEAVAKKLVKAYLRGKRDEYVSWGNRLLRGFNFFCPSFFDWLLAYYFRRR